MERQDWFTATVNILKDIPTNDEDKDVWHNTTFPTPEKVTVKQMGIFEYVTTLNNAYKQGKLLLQEDNQGNLRIFVDQCVGSAVSYLHPVMIIPQSSNDTLVLPRDVIGILIKKGSLEVSDVYVSVAAAHKLPIPTHTIEFDGSSVSQVVTLKKGKRALFSRGVLVDLGCDYDVPEVNV